MNKIYHPNTYLLGLFFLSSIFVLIPIIKWENLIFAIPFFLYSLFFFPSIKLLFNFIPKLTILFSSYLIMSYIFNYDFSQVMIFLCKLFFTFVIVMGIRSSISIESFAYDLKISHNNSFLHFMIMTNNFLNYFFKYGKDFGSIKNLKAKFNSLINTKIEISQPHNILTNYSRPSQILGNITISIIIVWNIIVYSSIFYFR